MVSEGNFQICSFIGFERTLEVVVPRNSYVCMVLSADVRCDISRRDVGRDVRVLVGCHKQRSEFTSHLPAVSSLASLLDLDNVNLEADLLSNVQTRHQPPVPTQSRALSTPFQTDLHCTGACAWMLHNRSAAVGAVWTF
jgi:hypothetical protein